MRPSPEASTAASQRMNVLTLCATVASATSALAAGVTVGHPGRVRPPPGGFGLALRQLPVGRVRRSGTGMAPKRGPPGPGAEAWWLPPRNPHLPAPGTGVFHLSPGRGRSGDMSSELSPARFVPIYLPSVQRSARVEPLVAAGAWPPASGWVQAVRGPGAGASARRVAEGPSPGRAWLSPGPHT